VAGVNLPLLIKALGNRRGPLDELVETLIDAGQRAIRLVDPAELAGAEPGSTREATDGAR
jgi:mannose/fructose-specific phosphotransferase system component IIA